MQLVFYNVSVANISWKCLAKALKKEHFMNKKRKDANILLKYLSRIHCYIQSGFFKHNSSTIRNHQTIKIKLFHELIDKLRKNTRKACQRKL